MAKICLIRPLLSQNDFSGYPLNLLILASCLKSEGHTVEICDFDFLKFRDISWTKGGFTKRAAEYILKKKPDFAGITSMCSNYVLALDLAQELKLQSPALHITFGGPHVSLCAAETLLRYPFVDTAVIGEGEITYPELIQSIIYTKDLNEVRGIAYRNSGNVNITPPRPLFDDLNSSPRPAYELVDIESYIKAADGSYLEIYAGSGCPFKCTFCSTSIVWERKYRTMTPHRIVDEMEYLNKKYGASAFSLIHDNLTSRKSFLHEIAEVIVERGLDIHWGFSSRVDTIDADTIKKVSDAGCNYVFFGIESGSEKIQYSMKKRLKLDRIKLIIEKCIKSGISPTTSFILGFPDETLDDISRTISLAFLCKVAGARRSFINLLSAYTGTPVMMEQIERMVFDPKSMNSTMSSYLEPQHFSIIAGDRFIFSNYYSLDYTSSALNAEEYSDIVDFYTICLIKYKYTFSYLVNDMQIDPLELFRNFRKKISALSVKQRVNREIEFNVDEFKVYAEDKIFEAIKSLLTFDKALWHIRKSSEESIVFSGKIQITNGNFLSQIVSKGKKKHYLLTHSGGEDVQAFLIPSSLSKLYETQGLYAIRC